MTLHAAERLHELLAALDPALAGDAAGDLAAALRLLRSSTVPDGPPIAVLVGPCGGGRSRVGNRLVGADVFPVGPLRPTTTALAAAGSDGSARLAALTPPPALVTTTTGGLVVLDTPAWEHDPDGVAAALEVGDVAILVTSALRYADRLTEEALAGAVAAGLPLAVVVTGVSAAAGAIRAGLAARVPPGTPLLLVEEGDEQVLSRLAAGITRHRDEIRAVGDATRLAAAVARARRVAAVVAAREREAHTRARLVERVFAAAPLDAETRRRAASVPWREGRRILLEAVAAAGRERREAVPRLWAEAGVAAPVPVEETEPVEDTTGLDTWRAELAATVAGAISPRWWRLVDRGRTVDTMWRLALDPERPVPRRLRRRLGTRLGAVRAASARSLDRVLVEATGRWATEEWRAAALPGGPAARQLRARLAALARSLPETPERVTLLEPVDADVETGGADA